MTAAPCPPRYGRISLIGMTVIDEYVSHLRQDLQLPGLTKP
jgi:hypothetical protein